MSRRYDHRIRIAIVQSGNQNLFPNLAIPKSTIRDRMKKGPANIVTTPELDLAPDDLIMKIHQLQHELIEVKAEKHLITKVFAVAGFQLQYKRIPNADSKTIIIDTIKQAAKSVGLDRCLETVQLSKSRFAAWVVRQKTCQLEDQKTCGRLSPTRLLNEEVRIRASAPGQIIHLDQSMIKLKDGTKCFIQAVICNFSRYVLAWQVSKTYGGCSTQQLLLSALEKILGGATPVEVISGTWSDMDREKLKIEAVTARRNRIHTNLNLQCGL